MVMGSVFYFFELCGILRMSFLGDFVCMMVKF